MLIHAHGVFRSGTTALFEAFRQDTGLRCYYELLHPELLQRLDSLTGRDKTGKRPSPKAGLFREFLDVEKGIREDFKPSFAFDLCQLDEHSGAADLERYLRILVASSGSVLLQFNRAFWLSRWLHEVFPDSFFIHIIRDPRAVVWSFVRRRFGVMLDLPVIGSCPMPLKSMAFSRFVNSRYFSSQYYAIGEQHFSGDLTDLKGARPYIRLLALWGAQVRVCHEQASAVFRDRYKLIRYEDFCLNPVAVMKEVYGFLQRDLPGEVVDYLSQNIHSGRLRSWCFSAKAVKKFDQGLEQAGIVDLADQFGYAGKMGIHSAM